MIYAKETSSSQTNHMSLALLRVIYRLPRVLITCLIVIITLAVFVPLSPSLPSGGLDPSWRYATNQAVAQHLVFGKDIIFTLGPYASIYTKMYHPATDHLMVFGSLYLAICYAAALVLLTSTAQLSWILIFGAILIGGFLPIPDALLLSYPLLLAIIVYRITLPVDDTSRSSYTEVPLGLFLLLFSAVGLLPLIKGSLLPTFVATPIFCFIVLLYARKRVLAYCSLASPAIAVTLLWLLSGQPLIGLPYYLSRMIPIVSGYSEAMALSGGDPSEIPVYLVGAGAILFAVAAARNAPLWSRLFLCCSFVLFLFLAFKGGFVRHDGHATIAGSALVIAAAVLALVPFVRYSNTVFLLAVLAWAFIDQTYMSTSTSSFYRNIAGAYTGAISGLALRVSNPGRLKENFNQRVLALKDESHIPLMTGTTDIYPYDQSYLIASGNTWDPRPVIQSYSAYTESLAKINEAHLLGHQAPDNLLFKIAPLDGRFPSLDDGISWPVILNEYDPVALKDGMVYLAKRADRRGANVVNMSSGVHRLGETVPLPQSSYPLLAEIDISPTLIGRLASLFYKPDKLDVIIDTEDGMRKTYRIIAGMARSGFVISPLVENTEDFLFLFADAAYWNGKRVKSIRLAPGDNSSIVWRSEYFMKISEVRVRANADVTNLFHFDPVEPEYSRDKSRVAPVQCEGSIDAMNGGSPAQLNHNLGRVLSIDGWLAVLGEKAVVPDGVFVTLTDERGQTTYIRARRTARRDVNIYFRQPGMTDVGFTASIDMSRFGGRYLLGLSRTYRGRLESCQQFAIPVTAAQEPR